MGDSIIEFGIWEFGCGVGRERVHPPRQYHLLGYGTEGLGIRVHCLGFWVLGVGRMKWGG
jgi:hypothetical protein